MWLTNSSVGRKLVMAVTGAALVLFVTFHVLMNAVAIFWPAAYNVICEFLGANWYALIASAGLALLFIIHIIYALWLTVQNRRARGHEGYLVNKKPAQVEWASKNMLVLGIVVVAFLIVHMIQFWAKMQLAEITGHLAVDESGMAVPPAAGTWFLQIAFSCIWTPIIYIIGFVALWFHLTHGIWSMFQSAGWNGNIWMSRLKKIGCWWATIVVGLFIIQAIVFTVNARNERYTTCPQLVGQYIEMMEEGKDAGIPGMAADCCGEALPPCCAEKAAQHGDCHKGHCDGKAECGKAACGDCKEGKCEGKAEGACCGKCEEGKAECGDCKEGKCEGKAEGACQGCEGHNNANN
ncbi:MAG: hypothetical protein K2M04_02625 [Muribaculaceae bacterium]|nr:hypothetical protein [Muribaculaceae bacterium]